MTLAGIKMEMVRGDTLDIHLNNELCRCYVTDDPKTQPYSFGGRLIIGLTEETFAHFIIRSKDDPTHRSIIERENELHKQINDALTQGKALNLQTLVDDLKSTSSAYKALQEALQKSLGKMEVKGPTTIDDIIEIQCRLIKLDNDYATLMVEKGQSGLRILQAMKKEYQEKKSLS